MSAKHTPGPLSSGELKALRQRVISHGTRRESPTGPIYVGCQCGRCRSDRAAIAKATGGAA